MNQSGPGGHSLSKIRPQKMLMHSVAKKYKEKHSSKWYISFHLVLSKVSVKSFYKDGLALTLPALLVRIVVPPTEPSNTGIYI